MANAGAMIPDDGSSGLTIVYSGLQWCVMASNGIEFPMSYRKNQISIDKWPTCEWVYMSKYVHISKSKHIPPGRKSYNGGLLKIGVPPKKLITHQLTINWPAKMPCFSRNKQWIDQNAATIQLPSSNLPKCTTGVVSRARCAARNAESHRQRHHWLLASTSRPAQ